MVATDSCSSRSSGLPYDWLIPMQPRPRAETVRPCEPSARVLNTERSAFLDLFLRCGRVDSRSFESRRPLGSEVHEHTLLRCRRRCKATFTHENARCEPTLRPLVMPGSYVDSA